LQAANGLAPEPVILAPMNISIVTPSFRNSEWLKLCIASVADQEGVSVEHIVQDSVSDDGTLDWLRQDKRVKAFVEKDSGMYDAINRGLARSTGDIVAYLNCDEQYLPGTLKTVADFFEQHPEIDALVGDTIVTDTQGDYICHRYGLAPHEPEMWVRFPVLSCAFFLRSRKLKESGVRFDAQWRALGDFFWVLEMVRAGFKFAVLPRFCAVFADTGENLSLAPNSIREGQRKWEMAAPSVKLLNPLLVVQYRLRLAARGSLWERPFEYSLYTLANSRQRVTRRAEKPTSFWRSRLKLMNQKGIAPA
jgi:glycosyltransferase involved in cell wall biosynthesis